MISFIIPSYNNLKHLKNVYSSIKRNEPDVEIILLDDASTDGSWDWMLGIQKTDNKVITFRTDFRQGHTLLYDRGIEMATNEIVAILHADMIIGPNYVKNILKHLKKGKVVCGTRIEPPLHPNGKEKIIKDFGMDFDTLDIDGFETFCVEQQIVCEDLTTKGMFAPWVIYKEDFQRIGGHDSLFAPYGYEDSDIFQRWILAGYDLIQSRDAFVYHLTCRGHRWGTKVGVDNDDYQYTMSTRGREFIRKWGNWIQNDEYQHPIIPPRYNIGYVVKGANLEAVRILEPWCDRLYVEDEMGVLASYYYDEEQKNTNFDLNKRLATLEYNRPEDYEDIVVEFNWKDLTNNSYQILQQLHHIIKDSGEIGKFNLDIFTITIQNMEEYQNRLIDMNDGWYVNKLKK